MQRWSALKIYNVGLADPDALSDDERMIYLIIELQNMSDMEGWDFFSGNEQCMRWYEFLKQSLEKVGAMSSLKVLVDFERYLSDHGVCPVPDQINAFLNQSDYWQGPHDWREQFWAVADDRWKKIAVYLAERGITLEDG